MAKYTVGATIAPSSAVATGAAPGSADFKYGQVSASAPGKITGIKSVNGQDYYNIDQSGIGGGTGWVSASAIDNMGGGNSSSSSPSLPSLQAPQNSGDVNNYLSQYSDVLQQAKDTLNAPTKSNDQIFSEVSQRLTPTTPLPTAPNLVDLFTKLTSDQGIQDLEGSLAGIKNQILTIQDQTAALNAKEEGKPLALNVISGRQTEEQRQAQVTLNYLSRRQSLVQDELTTRYSLVNTIMQFTQTDYQNAVTNYNTQFQQNVAIYNAFTGEVDRIAASKQAAAQTVLQGTAQLEEWARQDAQEARATANANLTLYTNLIKSGNVSFSNLSADQKLSIQKLEVQAGLGVGFVESITSDNANGKLIYAGSNGAVFQNADGTLSTKNYNVSGGSGSNLTADQKLNLATSEMRGVIQGALNKYGDISPKDWNTALQQWNQQGFSTDSFNKTFGQYADTNRGDFNSVYGFANPVDKRK